MSAKGPEKPKKADRKTIGAYFRALEGDGYPLNKEYYRTAYRELADEVNALGGRLVIVRGQETFLGGNTFSRYWEITPTVFVLNDAPITLDLIYEKGAFKPDKHSTLLNDPELDRICLYKIESYEHFPDDSPRTIVVPSSSDVPGALARISTERIVIKPVDGEEGQGVFILPRDEAAGVIPSYPYLLQEFLDLSGGIPGIVEGPHDLRMTGINGELVLCFVRTPPPNSLLANVAQGGKKIEVPLTEIPAAARAIWERVDGSFSRFPRRVYSVDVGRTRDGTWKIIELNSMPGCTCKSEGPLSVNFQRKLAAAFFS